MTGQEEIGGGTVVEKKANEEAQAVEGAAETEAESEDTEAGETETAEKGDTEAAQAAKKVGREASGGTAEKMEAEKGGAKEPIRKGPEP